MPANWYYRPHLISLETPSPWKLQEVLRISVVSPAVLGTANPTRVTAGPLRRHLNFGRSDATFKRNSEPMADSLDVG
ncbi:hypothetical protein VTI74DRAFT_9862 [Chaetomium olivicolor]